jgi:hypothetical protein
MKVLSKMFLMVFFFLCFNAQAAENKIYFSDEAACKVALADGSAMFYSPSLKRPAPKSWSREKLATSVCVQMETVQGYQHVVLPAGFEMAQHPTSKAWHAAPCTNYTNWTPGNKMSEPVAAVMPGVVQGVHAGTVMQTVCDAKCEAKKVCEQNSGTLDKMNEKGEWLCYLPGSKISLIQPVEASGVVQYQWNGWSDQGMQVPGATPKISVARPMTSVTGIACTTGQGCSSRPVAKWESEKSASYCGIRTTDGRLFKLGHDKTNGLVTVTDFTNGEGSGYARMILGGLTGNDCDKVQEVIESKAWADVTKHFKLPNACAVAKKLKPADNKISQHKT